MLIKHNMAALNANRQLGINNKTSAKTTEKLSSGYRINRSADDAAGLAISEKMRKQIRGLTQASLNAQDGISMVQIADGAMNEVHDMLQRSTELSVKAANGTMSESDRTAIDMEIQKLKEEINATSKRTVFNELRLFPDEEIEQSQSSSSAKEVYHYTISYSLADGTFRIGSGSEAVQTYAAIAQPRMLADKIANELVPNAIAQIFAAFPSLENATGSDTIDMALNMFFVDGPGGKLAYAQYAFTNQPGSRPVDMLLTVDTADFDDEDADGTSPMAEVLESTLAHELMHSVMQYNLTDGMSGRTGNKYPEWFIEGTAQLAGGGFPTNWNYALENLANQLSDETDTSQDAAIASYLQSYTMAGRPYGHGYLGAAYLGYLANGGGAVTAANIASGMDNIFQSLLAGKTLDEAIDENISPVIRSEQDLENLFAAGDAGLTEFVRKLSYNSKGGGKDGAGSIIATGGLGAGGTDILDNTASVQKFRIDSISYGSLEDPPGPTTEESTSSRYSNQTEISIHVGADSDQKIYVNLQSMNTKTLGLEDTNVLTMEDATRAIDEVAWALESVSRIRSYFGAIQNRLEHTIANLDNVIENTTAAESAIRDTDMAAEMVQHSNYQILLQAGQSMLAQANSQSDLVLGLLQ